MAEANAEYEKLIRENIRRKHQNREQAAEIERLTAELGTVAKERDDLRTSLTTATKQLETIQSEPDSALAQVAELKRELAETKARSRFEGLARGKVRDDALGDAWGFLGLDFAGGEVTDDAIEQGITSLVETRPYLKAETPAPNAGGTTTATGTGAGGASDVTRPTLAPAAPGQGLSRGSTAAPPPSGARSRVMEYASKTGRTSNPGRIA